MDLQKVLSGVKSLNDYIAATAKVCKCANIKIHLNMSTVLNLKKVRSLEIEYFNKCEDVGAAFVLFERMLMQPASKTWTLLGKELTATILYWLDAVRKHLISHSPRWWTFLETVLEFIRDLKSKDPSLAGILVEQTTECLLDLACNARLNELQRHDILQTMNECSAESSRELRLRMKEQLSGHFIKLSRILPTCGHFPTQMSMLEALLRWLVDPCDPQVRRAAALDWFPQPLYQRTAINLFLERTWADLFMDARQFLNLQNAGRSDLVASTVCKQLTFGNTDLIKAQGPQSRPTWLDVNAATRTVTITLDPGVVESFAATDYKHFETLVIAEENVISVQLARSSASDTKLSVHALEPLQLAGSSARAVTAAVSSRQLATLDRALRGAFEGKYRVSLNLGDVSTSPEEDKRKQVDRQVRSSDEIIRRSNIPLRRRSRLDFAVRSRNRLQWNSPSSASTTSLAQLHERLAALPHIHYTKEPVKICAQPELSMVREVSEGDELSCRQSSITKSKHTGICQKTNNIDRDRVRAFYKQNDDPPVTQEKVKPVSSMLIAAVASVGDELFINDTLDKITKNNAEFDMADLIAQRALRKGPEEDSGITVDKITDDSEVIENTPAEKQIENKKITRTCKAKCTIVSNSTTDESNTEPAIEVNVPCFVTDRRQKHKSKGNINAISEESKSFDAAEVEAFFSQHYTENAAGCHKTISEGSECAHIYMDEALIRNDLILEQDIIDCLNNIVDEVCCNLEKYAEMSIKQKMHYDTLEIAQNVDQDQNKNIKSDNSKTGDDATLNDGTKVIALKYSKAKKRAPKKKPKQNNLTKYEKADNMDLNDEDSSTCSPLNKPNTSLIRKKRKLYSPKDDENNEDEIPRAKFQSRRRCRCTETPIATCYRDLEIARNKRSRIPRTLRTSTEESPKKNFLNDMFDKLTERVDNEETITLVNRTSNKKDLTEYNFTSESEDEDFIKKKIKAQKRASRTSLESTAPNRGRAVNRINYSEGNYNSSDDEIKRNTKKRKLVKQTKPRSRKVNIESIDLTEERMREAPPEVLETSFVKESCVEKMVPDLEPSLAHIPEIEIIPEDKNDAPTAITVPENKSLGKKKAEILQAKKEKESSKNSKKNVERLAIKKEKAANRKEMVEKITKPPDSDSERSLPGLVVESEQPRKDVMSSSVEAKLLQNLKKICTDGPDIYESDATQNLLLRKVKTENMHVGNKDVSLDMCDDNFTDFPMNGDVGNNFEITDLNQNNIHSKNVTAEPMVLSGSPSEKSIATDGKSPITAHNDLEELPPNMTLLYEEFLDRDLEIQDMDQPMEDFFVQLRSAVLPHGCSTSFMEKEKTSELTFTRMSSKEQVGTPTSSIREWMKSPKSRSKDKVTTLKSSSKDKVTTLKSSSKDKVTTLKSSSDDKLTTLKSSSKDKVTTLKSSSKDKMTTRNSSSKDKVTTLKSSSKDKMTTLKSSSKDKMTTRKSSSKGKVTTLKSRSKDKVTTLKSSSKDKVTTLKSSSKDKMTTRKSSSKGKVTTLKSRSKDKMTTRKSSSKDKVTTLKFSSKDKVTTLKSSSKHNVTTLQSSSKDNVTTLQSSSKDKVMTLPVEEIEKYVSPVKSQQSMASMFNVSVVLQRISSDEISKWLPMPPANSDHGEKHNKEVSNTTISKDNPKRITKKTPEIKVNAKTIKSTISPVMFSFEETDKKSTKENVVDNFPNTRAKTNKLKILECKESNVDLEEGIEITTTQESSSENIGPELNIQSAGTVKDVFEKVGNVHTVGVAKYHEHENIEYTLESARSIASINEWFKKNIASSQYSSPEDKTNHTMKDIVGKMMETLETTLTEIHQCSSTRLASMFLDHQKRLSCLQQELRANDERANQLIAVMTRLISEKSAERNLRFRQMVEELQNELKKSACDVLREDSKQKRLMVKLLQEDLQAVLDCMDILNKK